jgi:hypothetical protein
VTANRSQPGYRIILLSLVLPLALFLSACTRNSVPLEQITAVPTGQEPTEAAPKPTFIPFEVAGTYGVIWIPSDERLEVHNPAGVAGSVVNELDYDARGIRLTGDSTGLGSSLWVEISTGLDQTGWVNFWNLTEDVSQDAFCGDERVYDLVGRAVDAIVTQDGDELASIANPRRGLAIRQEWWNPEVQFPPGQIASLFTSRESFDWGEQSGSEFHVNGSFPEVVLPLLQDVLQAGRQPVCNQIQSGVSSRPAEWPSAYQNLNFFTFFRPAPEKGNRYDWRAWALGFEYIKGEPYLTVMVHFHGDV